MSINGHSAACCTIPPIISKGYSPKGKFETIGGLKTYVTGLSTAKKAILLVYDIFGYFPQTIQGADILAFSDNNQEYQVFIPDFFEGEPADIAWYPPVTDEQKTSLYGWFSTRAPSIAIAKFPQILSSIEETYGKKTWGAVGFCWGGKVVSVTSAADTPFTATCQAHPGLIDPADAEKIGIPTCMLASGEENAEEVKVWSEALQVENYVETFGDQVHGWMSARGDLQDEKIRKEYERGYGIFLEFFGKHL